MGGVRVVIQRHARFQYLPHQWSGGEGGRHQPRELATLTRYLVLSCMLVLATWPVHAAEELRSFDHNKDGKVDQREYYHGSTLIRVEIDRDRNGLVDEWVFYEQGTPIRAEFDTTGNGKVTQREFYDAQGQIQRLEVDRNGDEVMEQHLFYAPGKALQ